MIGEESGVAGCPEQECRDQRVAQKAGTEQEGWTDGEKGQGVEDVADPETVGDGVAEDEEGGGWG